MRFKSDESVFDVEKKICTEEKINNVIHVGYPTRRFTIPFGDANQPVPILPLFQIKPERVLLVSTYRCLGSVAAEYSIKLKPH